MDQSFVPPSLSERINTNGFQRWHEYELARSFGYLGLGLIALIGSLAILEGFFDATSVTAKIFKAILSFFPLALAAWSWQRFVQLLLFAEHLSRQAICEGCGRYGKLVVLHEDADPVRQQHALQCRCKKCGTQWEMVCVLESQHE